ncbi:hypothetical protein U1Q18_031118, partial [Sarracenia purpurea var. burkii]
PIPLALAFEPLRCFWHIVGADFGSHLSLETSVSCRFRARCGFSADIVGIIWLCSVYA